MRNVLGILKTGSKKERAENFLILALLFGVALLSIGIGLTIISPAGLSVMITLLGSFLTFVFTVALVVLWFLSKGD